MSVSEMSIRERWIAALDFKEVDRLPFWPKIDRAYMNRHGSNIKEELKCDFPGGACTPVKFQYEKCSEETVDERGFVKTYYRTPHGEMCMVKEFDPVSCSLHPVEYPIKMTEDIKLMTEFYKDQKTVFDPEAVAPVEDDSTFCPTNGIGISPMMEWLQHLAGIENGHFMLMDYPELVEELFAVMYERQLARAGIIAEHTNSELIYMVENTSTTLVSPEQYRQYCKEHLRQISNTLHKYGKRLGLHMCGYIKELLPDIAYIKADAFEALTPPPVANTTLAQAREACPDTCLIGGTGAVTWLKPAKEIIVEIESYLDELPHHRGIIVTSGGVLPPDCQPETLMEVFNWLKKFKPRF
jgi:uroporphyrinogen-III decarboxylase